MRRPRAPESRASSATTVVRVDPTVRRRGRSRPASASAHAAARAAAAQRIASHSTLGALLRLVSAHYQAVDEERRGIVQSMRLMADEARAMAHEVRTQSSEHLQVILDHIKDVVLTVDEEGVIRTFNPDRRARVRLRRSRSGRRAHRPADSRRSPQHETVPQALQRLAASSGDTHMDLAVARVVGPAQGRRARSRSSSPSATRAPAAARCIVVCLRDVTERRESEQAMRESEARYRLLVDHAPEAIVVLDADAGLFVDVNENAERLFGLDREQLLQVGPGELSPPLQPDGAASARPIRAARGARARRRAAGLRVDAPRCVRQGVHVRGAPRAPAERQRAGWCAAASPTSRSASAPESIAARRARGLRAAHRQRAAAGGARIDHAPHRIRRRRHRVLGQRAGAGRRRVRATWSRRACRRRCARVLERTPIDIRNGSCAAAVYLGRQVLVAGRRQRSVLGSSGAQVALDVGLRAVWSMPIKAASGKLLGALGVYPRRSRACPTRASRRLHGARRAARRHRDRAAPRRRGAARAARRSSAACSRASPKACTRARATADCFGQSARS